MDSIKPKYLLTTRPIIPPYTEHPTFGTANPHVFLRPFRASDLPALHELRTQIEVMTWTSTGKIDADIHTTRSWVNVFMEAEAEMQDITKVEARFRDRSVKYCFVIVYRGDGFQDADGSTRSEHIIGSAGVHINGPEPECGYMIRKEYWGQGIATAALKAFLDAWWKLDRKPVVLPWSPQMHTSLFELSEATQTVHGATVVPEYLRAEIDPANTGSRRVLEKSGFQFYGNEEVEDRNEAGKMLTLGCFKIARPILI